MPRPLAGQTALVTGANSGIGRATSAGLVDAGARVLLLCRNPTSGEATRRALAPRGEVDLIRCDLEDPEAIRRAAGEVGATTERLDLLIHNAGLYSPRRRPTADGLERTFAVNHLGPFRLTHHLAALLGDGARVIVLGSRSHAHGRLDLEDLGRTRRPWHGYLAYADSKLCNLLFVRELARRLPHVRVNAVHPGIVGTGFAQDEPGLLHRLFLVAKPFMRTPERGARSVLWLATDPAAASLNRAYVVDERPRRPHRRALDDEAALRLWAKSLELAGPLPPLPPDAPPPAP